VLVATCIGEEGLDIGEVDLIICYDTQKTPIRMVCFGIFCHGVQLSIILFSLSSSASDEQDGNAQVAFMSS
jgi:hypothetical protein